MAGHANGGRSLDPCWRLTTDNTGDDKDKKPKVCIFDGKKLDGNAMRTKVHLAFHCAKFRDTQPLDWQKQGNECHQSNQPATSSATPPRHGCSANFQIAGTLELWKLQKLSGTLGKFQKSPVPCRPPQSWIVPFLDPLLSEGFEGCNAWGMPTGALLDAPEGSRKSERAFLGPKRRGSRSGGACGERTRRNGGCQAPGQKALRVAVSVSVRGPSSHPSA